MKSEKEIWNKILFTPQWGDVVKFKYGKANWLIFAVDRLNGKLQLKLLRRIPRRPYVYYLTVEEGTWAYKNLRIIETKEQRKKTY